MSKSAIQNQLRYVVANEQYLKPLLANGKISEEVYNEVLENLYNEYEIWKYGKIRNPSIEVKKKKLESKHNLAEQNPGFVSLTDMARNYNDNSPGYIIQSWLRTDTTIKFLSLWERNCNNKFIDLAVKTPNLTPKIWIAETHAIGIVSRQGKNGGTYADKEIAMHFMCWLSADMMLNVIKKYLEVMNDEENN